MRLTCEVSPTHSLSHLSGVHAAFRLAPLGAQHLRCSPSGGLLFLPCLKTRVSKEPTHYEQERRQVEVLAQKVQEVTGQSVEFTFVDQGYTSKNAANAAKGEGIELFVVKHEEAKKGFVLLPRRWVVKRSFAQVNIAAVGSLCLTCGRLASGVWLGTMKDCLKPLLRCISWLSPCLC